MRGHQPLNRDHTEGQCQKHLTRERIDLVDDELAEWSRTQVVSELRAVQNELLLTYDKLIAHELARLNVNGRLNAIAATISVLVLITSCAMPYVIFDDWNWPWQLASGIVG